MKAPLTRRASAPFIIIPTFRAQPADEAYPKTLRLLRTGRQPEKTTQSIKPSFFNFWDFVLNI